METAKQIRVMVTEDDEGFRRMLALFLESATDMELIASAINGEEAVRLYAVHQPDVVLMDINMPVLNGIEAMQAILRDYPQARIILFSAYTNLLYTQSGMDVSAAGKLAKPLNLGALLKAIRNVHAGLTVEGQTR
jgi:YesN/AraC family two-component response regulator